MPTHVAAVIGNLESDHGGAQQLLYDVFSRLPANEFDRTIYHMFGEGSFREAFEAAGVSVISLDAASNFDAGTFAQFVRQLRRESPDILHTNSPISGLWGRTAGTLAGVPHIVSTEHSVHDGYPLKHRLANGLTLGLAETAVAITPAVARSFQWWERPLLRACNCEIRTIPNGVDVDRIAERTGDTAVADGAGEGPMIGTVGRLVEAKGIETAVRALPRIRENAPDTELVVVGDGPRRDALESLAERLGVSHALRITGFVEDPFPEVAAFDVAMFPSRWEGFGLATAECMAASVPVVASDIPAFREVVGDAGVLVESESPAMFADAVLSLIDNPEYHDDLAQRGYDRVREQFGIDQVAEQYASVFRRAVA